MKFFQYLGELFGLRKTVEPPPQSRPLIQHKLASPKIIPGYVVVTNDSDQAVMLTGGALKALSVPANSYAKVRSPILENVMMAKEVWIGGERKVYQELAWVNEWDALEVIDNMIEEYARGRAYDLMSPEELKVCTFPLPRRALAELMERIGVKATRENESHTVKAR